MEEMVTISKQKYEELLNLQKIDTELILDISRGIKDILSGEIEEI
jgi:hypothetical protein